MPEAAQLQSTLFKFPIQLPAKCYTIHHHDQISNRSAPNQNPKAEALRVVLFTLQVSRLQTFKDSQSARYYRCIDALEARIKWITKLLESLRGNHTSLPNIAFQPGVAIGVYSSSRISMHTPSVAVNCACLQVILICGRSRLLANRLLCTARANHGAYQFRPRARARSATGDYLRRTPGCTTRKRARRKCTYV